MTLSSNMTPKLNVNKYSVNLPAHQSDHHHQIKRSNSIMAVTLSTAPETMTSISRSPPSSTTSHLPTTTLPGLLPELILEIFKSADYFPTALALNQTCHRLHSIWEVNADAIFPSIVECFPQAQELARTQAEACTRPGTSVSPRTPLTTAQRVSRNAIFSSRILKRFENRVVRESARRGLTRGALTSVERADFVRACYRAMTLAASGQRGIPHWLLEPLDMLAYMQLREAADFVNICLSSGRKESKAAAAEFPPRSLDAFAAVSWASLDLTLFHLDLMQLPVDHGGFRCWGRVPFDYFTVADGYQAQAGSARGARLADLLPLLAGIGFFARQERFSL